MTKQLPNNTYQIKNKKSKKTNSEYKLKIRRNKNIKSTSNSFKIKTDSESGEIKNAKSTFE
jgi:hypothetical protein